MRCLLLLLIFCCCCRPDKLDSVEALIAYTADKDNGLTKSAVVDDYRIELVYKPTDLLVRQEIEGLQVDETQLEKIRAKYTSYYYFLLKLSKNDREALQTGSGYGELVQILSFRMGNYVSLTTSKSDTIPVGDFALNRTHGLNSSTDLLFAFNREKTLKQEWVQFNLNEFGLGIGNQRFRFNCEDIEASPKINFKITKKD